MNDVAQRLSTAAQQFAARCGLHVERSKFSNQPKLRLARLLKQQRVDTVLDIGANTGQFALELLAHGYTGQIVSFEPLQEPWQTLSQSAASYPRWKVAERCALGDADGSATINVAGNSQSSSLLPMAEQHEAAAPESRYVSQQSIVVRRFDGLADRYLRSGERHCVKLDVQGFEEQVIEGMAEHFATASVVLRELSLTTMYHGEPRFEDAMKRMRDLGFTPWAIDPVFTDRASGQMLQVEVTFVRA
jgi:FkbM family methyltransferase